MKLQQLLEELKRRNVIKTAGAYGVAAWLLIQVAVTIKAPLHLPDWIDTAVIIAVLIGFPIALIIAWVFELTPEGLQKTDEIADSESESLAKSTGKKLNRIIIGSLSLVIVLLITERVFLAGDFFEEVEPSIAVLPFVNMSSDEENEYFADGLSEELLNRLAEVEALKVIGRTSSFKFKGKETSYDELQRVLNVNHILEGSVRKDGDQLRISASLVRASDGKELWSQIFDRELESIFAIQKEVAENVVQKLKVELSLEETESMSQIPTENPEAYEFFLKAKAKSNVLLEEIDSAIFLYQEVIKKDPKFSLAYAKLATRYIQQARFSSLTISEIEPKVRENIEKAIFMNPSLSLSYSALGDLYIEQYLEPTFENRQNGPDSVLLNKSLEAYQKANSLKNRNPGTLSDLAKVYMVKGDTDKALEYIKNAYELDPVNNAYGGNYALLLNRIGDTESALVLLDSLIPQFEYPKVLSLIKQKGTILVQMGRLDEAFKLYHTAFMNVGADYDVLLKVFALASSLDMPDYLQRLLDVMKKNNFKNYQDFESSYSEQLGDFERKLELDQTGTINTVGVDAERLLMITRARINVYRSNFEDAEQILREDLSKGINQYQGEMLREMTLGAILKWQGKHEEADSLFDASMPSEYSELKKQAYRLDPQKGKEYWNEFYFNNDRKINKFTFLDLHGVLWASYLEEMGSFDGIRKDRNRMRDAVIAYLKDNGDWDENWKVNDDVLFSKRPSYLEKVKERNLRQR